MRRNAARLRELEATLIRDAIKMTRSTWLQSPRKALLLVLLDQDGYTTFYEFLKSEYATENLEFWTRLELIFSGHTRKEVLEIGSSLLEEFDEESLNIRDSLRNEVVEILGKMSREFGLPSTPESIRSLNLGTQPKETHTKDQAALTRKISIFDKNWHRPPSVSNSELMCHSLPDGQYSSWSIPAMSRQNSNMSWTQSTNPSIASELSAVFVQNMKESFFRSQRKSTDNALQPADGGSSGSVNVNSAASKSTNTPKGGAKSPRGAVKIGPSSDKNTPRTRNMAMSSMKNILFKSGSPIVGRKRALTLTNSERPSLASLRANSLTYGDCDKSSSQTLTKRSSRSNSDLPSYQQEFESTETSSKIKKNNKLRAINSTSEIRNEVKIFGHKFGAGFVGSPIETRVAKDASAAPSPIISRKSSAVEVPSKMNQALAPGPSTKGADASQSSSLVTITGINSSAVDEQKKVTQFWNQGSPAPSPSRKGPADAQSPRAVRKLSAIDAPSMAAQFRNQDSPAPVSDGSSVSTPTWRDIAQRTINCDSSAFSFDDTQPEKEEKKSPISRRASKVSRSGSSLSLKNNRRTSEGDIVKSEDSLRRYKYSSPIDEPACRLSVLKDEERVSSGSELDSVYPLAEPNPTGAHEANARDVGSDTGQQITRATSWRVLANIKKQKYYSFDSPDTVRVATDATQSFALQPPREHTTASMISSSIATGGGLEDKDTWKYTAMDMPLFIGPHLCNTAEEGEHTHTSSGSSQASLSVSGSGDGADTDGGAQVTVMNESKRKQKKLSRRRKVEKLLKQKLGEDKHGGTGKRTSKWTSLNTCDELVTSRDSATGGIVSKEMVDAVGVSGPEGQEQASSNSRAKLKEWATVKIRQKNRTADEKHEFTAFKGDKRHSFAGLILPRSIVDASHKNAVTGGLCESSEETTVPRQRLSHHRTAQLETFDQKSISSGTSDHSQDVPLGADFQSPDTINRSKSKSLPKVKASTKSKRHRSVQKTTSSTAHDKTRNTSSYVPSYAKGNRSPLTAMQSATRKLMRSSHSSDSIARTDVVGYNADQMRDMDSPGIRHARVVQTENETMDALRSALAVYARNISHDDMFGTSHANGPLQSKRTGQVHPKNVGKDQVSGTSSGSSGDHGAKIGGEIKTNESKATHAQDQGIHTQAQSWGMASEESCVHPGTHAKRERRGSRARKSVGNIYRDVLLSHHIPDSTKSRSRSPSSPAVSKRNWTREGGDIEEHAHTDTNTDAYTFRDVGSDALTGTLGPQNSITEARTDTADSSVSRTVPITEGIECAHCQGTGKKPSPADDPLCACTCGEATRRGGPELADREPLSGVEVKVLRSAQRQMLSLMALDSFPRFLNSGLGTEFVERMLKRPPRTLQPDLKHLLDAYHASMGLVNGETNIYISWLTTVISLADMLPFCVTIATRNVKNSEGPYPLSFVNFNFLATTKYSARECIGRNCRFLQGPGTSFENTSRCRLAIKRGQPFETKFVNYKKDGERFKSKMRLIPVLGKDKEMAPTFYLGLQYDTSTSTRTDASYTFESLAEYIMANNNL